MIQQVTKLGRPCEYSDEIADAICARLSTGEPLTKVCADPQMPGLTAVYNWLRKFPSFAQEYARAKEEAADTLADEIMAIADDSSGDTYTDDDGEVHVNRERIERSRLRVEARKWIASKLKPKRWGDKIQQEHSGPGGAPIQVVTGVPNAPAIEHTEVQALPSPMLLDSPKLTAEPADDE